MAQPVGGDLHVNVPLTNVSVAYLQSLDEFIADKVFPPVPVDYKTGLYWKYLKGEWMRTVATERAPATESAGTGWSIAQGQYGCKVYAVHKDIDDQTRAIVDRGAFDLDRDATQFVMRDLVMKKELSFTTTYMSTGIWGTAGSTDQTGVSASPSTNQFLQWDNSASTPIQDIREQKTSIAGNTGRVPNTLVLGPQVLDKLVDHPEFTDRIKYTQTGIVTTALIAAVLGIDRVLVPMAVENTGVEGAADNINFIYGKSALLVYAAPNPGLLVPSGGYTFYWTGYLGAGASGQRMKKFRMESIASDRLEAEIAYDMEVIGSDLGVFFTDAVA